MEEKAHGGKRLGAGRKPISNKKKQITLYVETKLIFPFVTEEKMKEKLYDFIVNYDKDKLESKVEYKKPTAESYDGAKLPSNYVNDEPLSFDKLRQQIAVPAATNDFFDQMNRAEDLEELEAVGRRIKASGMTWKEQQRYHDYGKMIAQKKFI